MPPKRAVEAMKSTEECILQIGKFNNIIKWRESMQTIVTELYGILGMFFTTNVRYEQPRTAIKYIRIGDRGLPGHIPRSTCGVP